MRTRGVVHAVAVLALIWMTLAIEQPASAASPNAARVVPGQYIVTFVDSVADPVAKANAKAAQHGLGLQHTYRHAIKGFAATIPAGRLARLQADPDVASITEDRVVSIQAQTLPTGIKRIGGDLSSTVAGNGSGTVNVDVAVIDTGIQSNHPDLNVVGGVNCTSPNKSDWGDKNGHGTHVAGTIGALDNGIGVVGVAPGARLWSVRVLGANGSGSWASVICGIDWVTANASTIEVANMSLGGGGSDSKCGSSDAMHNAICSAVSAKVTFVVAAGNDAANANTFVPATYEEVITVSALADFNGLAGGGAAATCRTDVDDTLADFSNYGEDVDLIAPGVCIYSTWLKGKYNTISGTSMASPHVAGAAALYKAKNPLAAPAEVRSALQGAGTKTWNNVDDPDGIQEVLLIVGKL